VNSIPHRTIRFLTVLAVAASMGACSSLNPFSSDDDESASNQSLSKQATTAKASSETAGSPANQFMWQATLETVGFMPLESVDDTQGKIVSDWYIPPGAPLERFRVDVAFSSRALRAESIDILVERQELRDSGNWFDTPASPSVASNMIDSILARALVLRQESGTL
jgi:hypothetical protein